MTKFNIFLIVIIAIVGLAASLIIQRQAQAKLRENVETLRRQEIQLAELIAENQRLANLVAQATRPLPGDRTAELSKLRSEAAGLRKQAPELEKELEQKRQAAAPAAVLKGDAFVHQHNRERMDMAQPGKRADARNLVRELVGYAKAHQGQFPSSLDPIAQSLKARSPLTGTNEFEIVFQGALNDLTNLSLRGVAVIRERQPWRTQSGQWARVYGMADGAVLFVEPDDNFLSWEAEHIIPPPANQ
jgi:hypothetical protein